MALSGEKMLIYNKEQITAANNSYIFFLHITTVKEIADNESLFSNQEDGNPRQGLCISAINLFDRYEKKFCSAYHTSNPFFYSIDEADSDDKSVISNSEEDKDDDSSPGMSMLII